MSETFDTLLHNFQQCSALDFAYWLEDTGSEQAMDQ